MKSSLSVIGVAVFVLSAAGVWGQDLTGEWDLVSDIILPSAENSPEGNGNCQYDGLADLTQDGDQVSGPVTLDLLSGDPQVCPGALVGDLTGTVNDGVVGRITTTMQETLSYSGQFGDLPDSLSGSLNVTGGPFAGATGVWSGQRSQPAPALNPLALVMLALLLVAATIFALRRRRAT